MRKRKKGRKLSRKRDQRKALLKSLAVSLLRFEKIQTTEAKAKELRTFIEPLINKAKDPSLKNRRHLLKFLPKTIVKKLINEIAPLYKDRKGGYTRIIKTKIRESDGARMAVIELVK
jgi:large subunit ribosomal protein L17